MSNNNFLQVLSFEPQPEGVTATNNERWVIYNFKEEYIKISKRITKVNRRLNKLEGKILKDAAEVKKNT